MIDLEHLPVDITTHIRKFRDFLNACWAKRIEVAAESDNLEYDPLTEEDRIWDGIDYLIGIDSEVSEGVYLFSLQDIIDYKNKLGL